MCGLISILIPPFVGTDKSTQTCQNSRSPGRILYSGPSEFEAAVLHLDCSVRPFVPFEKSRKTARKRKGTTVLDVNSAFVEKWRLNLYPSFGNVRHWSRVRVIASHFVDGDSYNMRRKTKLRNIVRNSTIVHSCQRKSIGLIFSKSQTGSDVRYSCHHNSSRFTFPIFAHSCRFSVLHSLQSITPRLY